MKTTYRVGDAVRHNGAFYVWNGVVAHAAGGFLLVMDDFGYLLRVHSEDGGLQRAGTNDPGALEFGAVQAGLHNAVELAAAAPTDTSDYDMWLLPLTRIAHRLPLTPAARTYLTWPASTRRLLERAGRLLQERQREVFLDGIMGGRTNAELAARAGSTSANIRMARMRALRLLERNLSPEMVAPLRNRGRPATPFDRIP